MDNDNILYLEDQATGNEVGFEIVDVIEYNGETFYELAPLEGEDDALVILVAQEEAGEQMLVDVEDEELFQAVAAVFRQRLEEMLEQEES